MGKRCKKDGTSTKRGFQFVLFLLAAGVVFWGRQELLWGIKGYFFDRIDYFSVKRQSSLPLPADPLPRAAKVIGIPDYKHAVQFSSGSENLTCYRMVDFENRLVVCSTKGLKRPEAIDEAIQERTIRGRLERFGRGPSEERLRGIFQKVGRIRIQENAFVLFEDESPLPSPVKFGVLTFCVLLCCFSAYRLIKK